MRKISLVFLLVAGIICFSALAYADVPRVINYQGRFTDKDDNPLSGNYLVTFRFYDVPEGGNIIWEEGHILTLAGGMFNALLGSIKSLDVDFDKDLWLGIEVASDGEMSPRIKLASSAYAFNAQAIDMLDSSQLMRNDIDAVLSGSLTLKKDLVLARSSRIVMTDGKGQEHYLWVDNVGNLRLKQGLPASDSDGTIVGKEGAGVSGGMTQAVTPVILIAAILLFGFLLYSKKKK